MTTLKSVTKKKAFGKASHAPKVSPGKRFSIIAEAAYYRAVRRGFQNGNPVADWLAAEAEIDGKLVKKD